MEFHLIPNKEHSLTAIYVKKLSYKYFLQNISDIEKKRRILKEIDNERYYVAMYAAYRLRTLFKVWS